MNKKGSNIQKRTWPDDIGRTSKQPRADGYLKGMTKTPKEPGYITGMKKSGKC